MPSWTIEQHNRLIELVLTKVGEGAQVTADGLAIAGPGGGVMGLTNLVKTLVHVPENEWEQAIEPYLPLFVAPPTVPAEYETARGHLRIRLSPDASDPGWAAFRPVCEGLDQMLVWKTDCGAVTVGENVIEGWGVPPDQVWFDAREQTLWDEPRDRRTLAKGHVRVVWVSGSFFASSTLLGLEHLLSPGNRFGAVVMVPVRDALLYAEVNDEHIVADSAAMIDVGGRWYVDDPGAISADLFWYRKTDGGPKISRIVREVDRRYQPCWGPDFSATLAELSSDLTLIDRDRKRRQRKRTPTA